MSRAFSAPVTGLALLLLIAGGAHGRRGVHPEGVPRPANMATGSKYVEEKPFPAVTPTNGMTITSSTTFEPGTYNLPDGITVSGRQIKLDMGGAVLVGNNSGYGIGVTVTKSSANVSVTDGAIHGYFYGVAAFDIQEASFLTLNLSNNWQDPLSNSGVWLNILAPPNLHDKTNLGGGMFLIGSYNVLVKDCEANNNENGFDFYDSVDVGVEHCSASYNTGWGVHYNHVTKSVIWSNVLNYCNRKGSGDSAGVLLVNGSNDNSIEENYMNYGGDGFFIGNQNGPPSNMNTIKNNDANYATNNAFEATFAYGNSFKSNVASYSNYGFWLGYSYTNVVEDNAIVGCGTGVQINHGQGTTFIGNNFVGNNGPAIGLATDGKVHFPASRYPWLKLPDQTASDNYAIYGNYFYNNKDGVQLVNTTTSHIYNNYFGTPMASITADALSMKTTTFLPESYTQPFYNPVGTGINVVYANVTGGNWYADYKGEHTRGKSLAGIGTTDVPYTNGGKIDGPGDMFPLFIPNAEAP